MCFFLWIFQFFLIVFKGAFVVLIIMFLIFENCVYFAGVFKGEF